MSLFAPLAAAPRLARAPAAVVAPVPPLPRVSALHASAAKVGLEVVAMLLRQAEGDVTGGT